MTSRFVFQQATLDEYFRQWLQRDARQANLSWKYRLYYAARPLVPLGVRHWLQQRNRPPVPSDWYLPTEFVTGLAQRLGDLATPVLLVHPWPHGAEFAFVLTHDVETQAGVDRMLEIANMEEELGFRSSWNLVPHKYKIDAGLVRDLTGRGFEIGIHGYNHDGRLFASRATFDRRVRFINQAFSDYQAVGFRAPMVHRNLDWLQTLDAEYDASCFDIDPFQPMAGGVGGIWPFMAGHFVELPYTLPQDHTLFIALGDTTNSAWIKKLEFLRPLAGMALMLTHPDYLADRRCLEAYHRFLLHVQHIGGYWHALPRDVARWWRIREELQIRTSADGMLQIAGTNAEQGSPATLQLVGGQPRIQTVKAEFV